MVAQNEIDIILNTMFKSTGIQEAMREIRKMQKAMEEGKAFARAGVKFDEMGNIIGKHNKKFNTLAEQYQYAADRVTKYEKRQRYLMERQKRAMQEQKKYNQEIENMQKRWASNTKAFKEGWRVQGNVLQKLGGGLQNVGAKFDMAGLSVLFFGMQLYRLASGIIRSTLGTFLEITEGSTQAGSAVNELKVAFKVLSFSIGEALANTIGPLVPMLIEVVMGIANWIQQYPKLTSAILLGTAALGGFMMIFGSLILGLSGIASYSGRFITFLGEAATKGTAASKGLDLVKNSLSGIAKSLGVLAGIGLTIDGLVGFGKAVLEGDWKKQLIRAIETALGVSLVAGIMAGSVATGGLFFLGTLAALLAISVTIDILKDFKVLKDTGQLKQGLLNAARNALPNSTGEWIGDILTLNIPYLIRLRGEISNESVSAAAKALAARQNIEKMGKNNFITSNYGNTDNAIQAAIIKSKQMLSLQQQANNAIDLSTREALLNQVNALDAEIQNIAVATGKSAESFRILAENQRIAAESTKIQKEEMVSLIQTVTPEQIEDIGNAFGTFVDKLNAMNVGKINELAASFTVISSSLQGSGENGGTSLLAVLDTAIDKIAGKEDSIVSAFDVWMTKMDEVQNKIAKFVPEVEKSTKALEEDAMAARSAAKAQERYNAAKNGATGAV